MRKRRMPEEKIARFVELVEFEKGEEIWLPQLESCFFRVLKYEYYLDKVPENIALPRYRKVVTRIVFRLLSQVERQRLEFSNSIERPDPLIKRVMEYLVEAEFARKRALLERNPITRETIRLALVALKKEFEV